MQRDLPICLIIPPSIFLADERVFPSLGILKVAAVLEQAKYQVVVLDLNGVANYLDILRAALKEYRFLFIGITATSPQMVPVNSISETIRQEAPEIPVVLGGPHITAAFASWKVDQKGKGSGRGTEEVGRLQNIADILVVGDGEIAIVKICEMLDSDQCPSFPFSIDGDNLDSELFLSEDYLNNLPLPARHLVDLNSYHYSIEGKPSTSLISELGCLAAGTKIILEDGQEIPIENISTGDRVICWDEYGSQLSTGTVVNNWGRDADDLWRLRLANGAVLLVTSEHPLWTENGWRRVDDLKPEDRIAVVQGVQSNFYGQSIQGQDSKILQQGMLQEANSPEMSYLRKAIHSISGIYKKSQFLFKTMQMGMAKAKRVRENAHICSYCSGRNESQMECDDQGGETFSVKYQSATCQCENSTGQKDSVGDKTWQSQSDEKTRGGKKSIGNSKGEGKSDWAFFSSPKTKMERWKDAVPLAKESFHIFTEYQRNIISKYLTFSRSRIFLRWQWGILDWAVPIWKTAKSRFYTQTSEKGNLIAWGALAFGGICDDRTPGLSSGWLEHADDMDERATSEESIRSDRKDCSLQFTAIKSREWIGKAHVYNMTVCPGHSYIANGIVVHNCSYGCFFCGMRNSPSFRKIRARDPESVKEELIHLHSKYGYSGFMFSDDELNIPSNFPMLMRKIIETQEEVGEEFRLRCFAKSNLFTEDQAQLMYQAGFRHILIGFESGSDRILTNINKRATREQNTKCMEIAHKYGLKIKALMSIGHPGESEKTIRETEDWLLEVQPHDFDATVITVYFGTPYSDSSRPHETIPRAWTFTAPKTKDRIHFYEVDFTKNKSYYKGIPGEYKSYTFSDYLSCEQIVQLRDNLENNIRAKLGIPFYPVSKASRIETSMGQGFPSSILRTSDTSF